MCFFSITSLTPKICYKHNDLLMKSVLYVMEWEFKTGPDYLATGFGKFLASGAPFANGAKVNGRYHSPGTVNGWFLWKLITFHPSMKMQRNGENSLHGR